MRNKLKKIINILLIISLLFSSYPLAYANELEGNPQSILFNDGDSSLDRKAGKAYEDKNLLDKKASGKVQNKLGKGEGQEKKEDLDFSDEFSFEDRDYEIDINLLDKSLPKSTKFIVKGIDPEGEKEERDLLDRITQSVSKKLDKDKNLKKVKVYQILFTDTNGREIKYKDKANLSIKYKKPLPLKEEGLEIYSFFDNEADKCENLDFKRNDRGEIEGLSFDAKNSCRIVFACTKDLDLKENPKEKDIFGEKDKSKSQVKEENGKEDPKEPDRLKEESQEKIIEDPAGETYKEEIGDSKKTDPQAEAKKIENSEFSKKDVTEKERETVLKYKKILKDEENKDHLTDKDLSDLKKGTAITYDKAQGPVSLSFKDLDLRKGYFLIRIKNPLKVDISSIQVKAAGLDLIDEIYSTEQVDKIRDILDDLTSPREALKAKPLKKLFTVSYGESEEDLQKKKATALESLAEIKPAYSLKEQGLTKEVNQEGVISLRPVSSSRGDLVLAFKLKEEKLSEKDFMSIDVKGEGGDKLIEVNEEGLEGKPATRSLMALPSYVPGTVNTVNNVMEGITLDLFDYGPEDLDKTTNTTSRPLNRGINIDHSLKFLGSASSGKGINNYTGGKKAMQGIVKNTLEEGYPVLQNGESLDYLFDRLDSEGKTTYSDTNYLFQKDSDGYYYYDSNTNYAYLDTSNKEFEVYNRTYNSSRLKPIGFFPFNDYNSNKWNINPGYGYDHHFGMRMEAEFSMPENKTVNGQDMIFDFSGDDDIRVFIDDVLVLDMGGIHDKINGQINFTTGDVTVDSAIKAPDSGQTNGARTTLNDIFRRATGNEFDESDFSDHTISFFFLERGSYESNCSLSFNLPFVPTTPLEIGKKISGNDKYKFQDEEFSFQVRLEDQKGSKKYYPYTGPAYYKNGLKVNFDENGVFKLKDGEKIVIPYINNYKKYYIKELGVDGDQFETVELKDEGQKKAQVLEKKYEDENTDLFDVETEKELITSRNKVSFINYAKGYELPDTGSTGRVTFQAIGFGLIVVALLTMFKKRKGLCEN